MKTKTKIQTEQTGGCQEQGWEEMGEGYQKIQTSNY